MDCISTLEQVEEQDICFTLQNRPCHRPELACSSRIQRGHCHQAINRKMKEIQRDLLNLTVIKKHTEIQVNVQRLNEI